MRPIKRDQDPFPSLFVTVFLIKGICIKPQKSFLTILTILENRYLSLLFSDSFIFRNTIHSSHHTHPTHTHIHTHTLHRQHPKCTYISLNKFMTVRSTVWSQLFSYVCNLLAGPISMDVLFTLQHAHQKAVSWYLKQNHKLPYSKN